MAIPALSITLGALAWVWVGARRDEAGAQARLASAMADTGQGRAGATAQNGSRNFALALGDAPNSQQAVQAIQGAAQQAGAAVGALRVVEQAPSVERLARMELGLEMKAPYPAIKATLANAMDALDHATLARLQLQADPAGNGVQAQLVLHVWGAPLGSAPTASAR